MTRGNEGEVEEGRGGERRERREIVGQYGERRREGRWWRMELKKEGW
jgi:hypothetical protein